MVWEEYFCVCVEISYVQYSVDKWFFFLQAKTNYYMVNFSGPDSRPRKLYQDFRLNNLFVAMNLDIEKCLSENKEDLVVFFVVLVLGPLHDAKNKYQPLSVHYGYVNITTFYPMRSLSKKLLKYKNRANNKIERTHKNVDKIP